jgi:queuosine precursor transporter
MIQVKNRLFFILVLVMALVVALSNYLVQFPFNYFGMQDLLTYGAFSYPIAFLITDLTNRQYGKTFARKIVYFGFILGIALTLYFSTDFSNLISKRVALGSGVAFLVAQLFDVQIFDKLRKRVWFVAPLASSLVGSTIDTFLFFSIAFYGTGVNWVSLSFGDLLVKIIVAVLMLIPFRLLLSFIRDITIEKKKINA